MKSIKSRVMISSLIVLVGFMILTAFALEVAIEKRMLRAEEDKLMAQMYSVLAAVDRDSTGLSITVNRSRLFETALFDTQSDLRALLYDSKGEIWRSASSVGPYPKPQGLKPEEMRFSQLKYDNRNWFQLAFYIRWPNVHDKLSPYQIVLWKDAKDYFAMFKRFRQTLWLWFVVTLTLLMVFMWLVMLWGLRPLRRIGEEVTAIENGDKFRFDGRYPSEITPLTQNLNLLLQREQYQMQRYRNALDDLAHSLKTPLAVLSGIAQKKTWQEEDRSTLQEQNQRMNQIVTYQLQKAATVGGELIAKPVDVIALLQKTVNALRKVYAHKSIVIDSQMDANCLVRMDESDLLEILGNLIDNACKYGDQRIILTLKRVNQIIMLSIEDDGEGLEPSQLQDILQRGKRLDQKQEGQGIGLAVVDEIVQAYEIGIEFSSSSTLGGLKVELSFNPA
jgi:two-component system, OmpR family, sensor histidine kinase PhoQ